MAHPNLDSAVDRLLDEIAGFEAKAAATEFTDTDILWDLLDLARADLREAQAVVAAIHQEATRLRAADIAQIHECYGTQGEKGRELASELVASLGVAAFNVCAIA
jgi:hypothetical protein